MSDTLYFSRDTRLLVEVGPSEVWEVPVLAGYSFSQATNTSEIALNEASDSAGNSRRGRKMFNESLAPAEWSISTYARPYIRTAGNLHQAVELPLWKAMVVGEGGVEASAITATTTNCTIGFSQSNKTSLKTVNLYFLIGGDDCASGGTVDIIYKVTGAVVNELTATFDIDGITTLEWAGFGNTITEVPTHPTITHSEAIHSQNNFIRNRLTSLTLIAADKDKFPGAYDSVADEDTGEYKAAITGGSITISNNITFLTPENLGVVNTPIGHVTGTRSVSGSFTCYLAQDAGTGQIGDLFNDLIENKTDISNSFDLTLTPGGTLAPRVAFRMENTHLEIPTHAIDDVISVEVNFHGLPSCISNADELTVTYTGVAP